MVVRGKWGQHPAFRANPSATIAEHLANVVKLSKEERQPVLQGRLAKQGGAKDLKHSRKGPGRKDGDMDLEVEVGGEQATNSSHPGVGSRRKKNRQGSASRKRTVEDRKEMKAESMQL